MKFSSVLVIVEQLIKHYFGRKIFRGRGFVETEEENSFKWWYLIKILNPRFLIDKGNDQDPHTTALAALGKFDSASDVMSFHKWNTR